MIASAPPMPTQKRFVDHVGTSSFCGMVAIVVVPTVVVGPASPGITNNVVVGPGLVVGVEDVVVPRVRVTVVRGRVVAVDGAVVAGDVTGGSVRGGEVTGGCVPGGCVSGGWVGGVVTTWAAAGATPINANAPVTTASRTARTDVDRTVRCTRRAITVTSGHAGGTRGSRASPAVR